MPKSPEQYNHYSEDDAQKEALEMQEKIKTGEARNYYDAEKQLETQEKIKILESYSSPLVYKRDKEVGLGFDYGFIRNKEEFLRLWKDTVPHSFDRNELMSRISLVFNDDYKKDLQNLDNKNSKIASIAREVINEIMPDLTSVHILKEIIDASHGELKKEAKNQLKRVVNTPEGGREAINIVQDYYIQSRRYGGMIYDQDIINALISAVENVNENNIPDWFLKLAEEKPNIISEVYDFDDGINRDKADRGFKKAFDSKIRELTIDKTRAVSDEELIEGGAKYKNKILQPTTRQIEEMRQEFQRHDEEIKDRKDAGKFKPQKAEWIDGSKISILFKRGEEETVVEVKINREKDGVTAWHEILYPGGGWETDVNKRPVDEIVKEIEKKFGVKIASEK
ncbi:hypothetical protein EPN15_02410 [Patescibacteria group bacterium]|nr:MAG: hypothetical protein EPN15_02410 [Patescibacteria group bacterium]